MPFLVLNKNGHCSQGSWEWACCSFTAFSQILTTFGTHTHLFMNKYEADSSMACWLFYCVLLTYIISPKFSNLALYFCWQTFYYSFSKHIAFPSVEEVDQEMSCVPLKIPLGSCPRELRSWEGPGNLCTRTMNAVFQWTTVKNNKSMWLINCSQCCGQIHHPLTTFLWTNLRT